MFPFFFFFYCVHPDNFSIKISANKGLHTQKGYQNSAPGVLLPQMVPFFEALLYQASYTQAIAFMLRWPHSTTNHTSVASLPQRRPERLVAETRNTLATPSMCCQSWDTWQHVVAPSCCTTVVSALRKKG